MTTNASSFPGIPGAKVRGYRTLLAVTAALFVAGSVSAYQYAVSNKRPPSFSRGGEFASADDLLRAGKDGRPYPYGDAPSSTSTPTSARGATVRSPVATTRAPEVRRAAGLPAVQPVVPADGAYTYAVEGWEGASGLGRRDFPKEMGLVVHANPGHDDQRVFDLRFSSQHEEREIVRFGPDGLAFVYEAGSITFGPMTQTSEGTYSPPMVQIPFSLAIGTNASATSPVTDSGGGHPRTEKWTARVIGRESVSVLGAAHDTWVVEIQRNTTPGTAEQVDRYRKYWYDPALGIWVKWIERFHGSRDAFVTFNYDAEYTATLKAFTAAGPT